MEKKSNNVVAIVVTYNRKVLLSECIESLKKQSYCFDKIVLIDNNSSDGTYEYLKEKNILDEKICYKKLPKNIGGSGGFYEGFKEAQKFNPDYLWIMDDDTIPTDTALEKLLDGARQLEYKFSYLASSVYGEHGEFMNVPQLNLEKSDSGYPNWYEYLDKGIVKIKEATFVSLLINNNAVIKIGYPMKNYFIWGDDTEYTLRLNKYYGKSYMIGKSKVIHKRKNAKALSIFEEDNMNRITFYFYMVRNNLLNKKAYYGTMVMIKSFVYKQIQSILVLITPKCKYKIKKFLVIHKALLAFAFGIYDKKAFDNRLDINVKYKED